MKYKLSIAVGVVLGLLTLGLFSLPAHAAEGSPVSADCEATSDWFVNPDEENRKPTPDARGFVFSESDLVHHAVSLPLADLKPGSFTLAKDSGAPDQPSFFSVEVRDPSGAYGTLRWHKAKGVWTIVIGAGNEATAGSFENADPVELLKDKVSKWGAFTENTKVFTFGVGYTLNPPGTAEVTVESVEFMGKTYTMVCPPVTESPSPTPTPTVTETPDETASPSPSATSKSPLSTPPATRDSDDTDTTGGLPVTGPGIGLIAGAGGAALLVGAVLLILTRRRASKFSA